MRFLRLVLLLCFTTALHAQDPVEWKASFADEGAGNYLLNARFKVADGWKMYSMEITGDDPVALNVTYPNTSGFQTTSEVEVKGRMKGPEMDNQYNRELSWYDRGGALRQSLKVDAEEAKVEVAIQYAVSNGSETRVLRFIYAETLKGGEESAEGPYADLTDRNPVKWEAEAVDAGDGLWDLRFTAYVKDGWKIYPTTLKGEIGIPTSIHFTDSSGTTFELVDEVTVEGELIEAYDDALGEDMAWYKKTAVFVQRVRIKDANVPIGINLEYMTCDAGACIFPDPARFSINVTTGSTAPEEIEVDPNELVDLEATFDIRNPVQDCGGIDNEGKGLWTLFVLGFLGGLFALITPCVFPMIPLTVSFFTKGSSNRKKGLTNAILYGLCILGIYLLFSAPFHFLESVKPNIFNEISTNVWLNLAFGVVFIIFAISFFGYFELTLPSSWSNKADQASQGTGIIGIFFMALTLAIVSFSCTGPILGTVLVNSFRPDGGPMQVTAAMGGFGVALALPFALFAMFPGWLNSIPKSGGWLNTVKVVFAFVELALAVKFLSNADLVIQSGILKRETFFLLWILCGLGLVIYLFGLIRFPHDPPKIKLKLPRIAFAVLVFAFVIYMIPGVTNTEAANRKLLSGFPPPLFYSWYQKESKCPLDLECYKDFDEGVAAAQAQNKPILLDFTGWACVNCRRMEENVWSDAGVFQLINEEYVLISLYVDDKRSLDSADQFVDSLDGQLYQVKTIGDKWSHFQTLNTGQVSQPLYCLLSPDGKTALSRPVAYTPIISEYRQWLECGLESFAKYTVRSHNNSSWGMRRK